MLFFYRRIALAIIMCSAAAAAGAQSSETPKASQDAGTIVKPPDVDRRAVKPAPIHPDQEIAVPPGKKEREAGMPRRRGATDADCKGPPELCRQNSPK